MEIKGNVYNVTLKKQFNPQLFENKQHIIDAFNFAWEMTFGSGGQHRDNRTGGDEKRKNGQIFSNTFQGKLAEFAVYQELHRNDIKVPLPDLTTYGLGNWDISDFSLNNVHIAVKSTAFYGNLLLLETGDWDTNARYIPSNIIYDYIILGRIEPCCTNIMKNNRLFYSQTCDYETLKKIILSENWTFDIPGFITKDNLKYVIENKWILPKGALLNGTTTMDAKNYYVESGRMHDFNFLCMNLRSITK